MTGASNGLGHGWRALIAVEIMGTSGIGFMMFDARRAGLTVEIILGMIVLGSFGTSWMPGQSTDRARRRAGVGGWLHHENAIIAKSTEDLLRVLRRGSQELTPFTTPP